MFCKNCGKEIEDNSKFCRYCGADVTFGGDDASAQEEKPREEIKPEEPVKEAEPETPKEPAAAVEPPKEPAAAVEPPKEPAAAAESPKEPAQTPEAPTNPPPPGAGQPPNGGYYRPPVRQKKSNKKLIIIIVAVVVALLLAAAAFLLIKVFDVFGGSDEGMNMGNFYNGNGIIMNGDNLYYANYYDGEISRTDTEFSNETTVEDNLNFPYQLQMNGDDLYFTAEDTSEENFNRNLYMVNIKTGDKKTLIKNVQNYFIEGESIYYMNDENDDMINDVFSANLDGLSSNRLIQGVNNLLGMHEGYLYYSTYDEIEMEYTLCRMEMAEKEKEEILTCEGLQGILGISGSELYYAREEGDEDPKYLVFTKYDMESGGSKVITDDKAIKGYGFTSTFTGEKIYYLSIDEYKYNENSQIYDYSNSIYSMDISTGEPTLVENGLDSWRTLYELGGKVAWCSYDYGEDMVQYMDYGWLQ